MTTTYLTAADLPVYGRILVLIGIAVLAHLIIRLLRATSERYTGNSRKPFRRKLGSVLSLVNSALIFALYFVVLGFVLRVKFRIWPGRGDPIGKTFRHEVVARLREIEAGYQDWQVAVYYEVESKSARAR